MDINMKDMILSKEDDGWVYINEIINGTKKAKTKLLYDDGMTAEEVYKKSFTDISVKGRYELVEDYISATPDYIRQ